MINTTIIYNRRKQLYKDGTAAVEVRVTVNRKSHYINTGVRVRPREWKFEKVVNRGDADVMNERIGMMLERVDRIVNESMKSGQVTMNFADVRRKVWAPDSRKKVNDHEDMVAWMEGQVKMLAVAQGTKAHYGISVARLAESGIMRKWSELTVENLHRWDAWLHALPKHRTDAEIKAGKRVEYIGQATVRNYHKDIKALLTRALKFGLITTNPYDRMKGEIKRGDRETVEYLTIDELSRIEQLELTDGSMLSVARDLFIFQAYTGMAYSDMQAFRLDECRHDDGRWLMVGQRVKTGVTFYVQILPQALAVAEKYGGELPRVVVQVYNRSLKAVAEMAKIRKRVTSHVARHTFATLMLSKGAKIENVSKMLGHTDIKMTQRYAKVLAKDVFAEFDKLK